MSWLKTDVQRNIDPSLHTLRTNRITHNMFHGKGNDLKDKPDNNITDINTNHKYNITSTGVQQNLSKKTT